MRQAALLPLFVLAGCGATSAAATSEPPARSAITPTPTPTTTPKPAPSPSAAEAPEAAVIDDSPLPWGTRPSRTGPLFPVIDGVCVHGEVWPLTDGTTLFSYGNPSGGYSRGGAATLAVFTDSGLDRNPDFFKLKNAAKEKSTFDSMAPFFMAGTWSPGPLLVYSNDGGGSRTRDYPTIWQRTPESGWSILATYGGDEMAPSFGRYPLLFKGNAIVTKYVTDHQAARTTIAITATRLSNDAPTLANIGALARSNLSDVRVYTNDEELYLTGSSDSGGVLRVWRDGKVRDVKWPPVPQDSLSKVIASKPSLLIMTEKTLHRLEGGNDTFTTWPITGIPNGSKPKSAAVAPNGDVWIALTPRTMVLKREAASGKIFELPVPLPADTTAAKEGAIAHWPTSGADLVGVEYNDPYVITEGGQIAHFDMNAGKWSLIEMPKAPFASVGRYRAQLLAMPSKGDLYVNAGYGEKGVGWKTWERYRAILRTKRPNETLRCNEPGGGASWASGKGFMSFPPRADDKCTTPFVMIVRTAYDLSSPNPMIMHDKKSDWPTVRESVKATPSLAKDGATTIDLVEFESGDQRYVGAKVPNLQAGKDLIDSATKRVKVVGDIGLRPELLCATTPPKIVRTIRVDLSTGKTVSTQ